MKKIISLLLGVTCVFAIAFSANAAKARVISGTEKSPIREVETTYLKLTDLKRLIDPQDGIIAKMKAKNLLSQDKAVKTYDVPEQDAQEPVSMSYGHQNATNWKIINAKRLGPTEIAIRLKFESPSVKVDKAENKFFVEDYIVTTRTYKVDSTDPRDQKVYVGADEIKLADDADRKLMLAKYGSDGVIDNMTTTIPKRLKNGRTCFYFGLFDEDAKKDMYGNLIYKRDENGQIVYDENGNPVKQFHDICGFGIAQRVKRWPEWSDLSFGRGSYDQASRDDFYEVHTAKEAPEF